MNEVDTELGAALAGRIRLVVGLSLFEITELFLAFRELDADPLDLGNFDAERLQLDVGERRLVVTAGDQTEGRNGQECD